MNALAGDPQWLSMLHFDRDGLFDQPRSAVLDNDFFFAPDGRHSPQRELRATLNALRQPPVEGKTHARCRFPARALWLTRKLGEQWPEASCPEWEAWQQRHGQTAPTLIFASGYLGNPASFFGHLMLHLEQKASPQDAAFSYLMDTSLNFGADVPENDGLATYMAKGLLGGYRARYSRAPFYRNTTLYSEREMRDLWQYRLALSEPDRELLVAHLYEIMGHDYEYLFLTQNCASRIARTLELVVDEDLTPGHAPWVAPEALIRAVGKAHMDGTPLLADVRHEPSRRLKTQWRYHDLTHNEQQAAQAVWPLINTLALHAPRFQRLKEKRQSAVLDTLLGHAAFLKQTGEAAELAGIERQLLQARLELPAGAAALPERDIQPIHESTPPGLVRISGVHNSELGNAARLTLRPLQYDLLDSNASRMPDAALEMARTELDFHEGSVRLRRFDLFHITNLHARSVPLPDLPGTAWHASGSVYRARLSCDNCLEGGVTLLAGKSSRLGRHLPFALFGGQLRTTRHQTGPLAPAVQLGLLSNWSTHQRTLMKITRTDALKGKAGQTTRWEAQYRWRLGKTLDLRAGVEGDDQAHEIRVGFSTYW
ncbi:DUF4105 domain-containing protein [Halomonas cibimaris]|uniref:DUF4105 domain-containing protein n=1 Tax=Halomonas cibimaris TaxID=657012 RepID=A0ABP7L7H5_9GAMM